jgi:hypothetical protein
VDKQPERLIMTQSQLTKSLVRFIKTLSDEQRLEMRRALYEYFGLTDFDPRRTS